MQRSSMRKPIPPEMREQLEPDPFMQACIITDGECAGVIQWHHGLTYAGRRVNERYAIIPMCALHHMREAVYRSIIEGAIRGRIRHFDAETDFRAKYPKSTLL